MRTYIKDDIEQISRDKATEASNKLLKLLLEHHGEDEDDPPPLQRTTIESIQTAVAMSYGVTRAEMLSARRSVKIIKPRHVAMYLCRELTPRSLPAIAQRFGDRDHTTIHSAIKKITRLLMIDPLLEAEIETIRAQFKP